MSNNDISDFAKHQHIIEECKKKTISVDEIRKLAKLARIKLTDEELSQYSKDLAGVIGWLDKLNDVEIDPLNKFVASDYILMEKLVDDTLSDKHADVLSNAETEHNCFVVPKIIENQ